MLSNQADYNQSDQDTEAEYTAVINLSGRHLKRIECLPKGVSPYTLLLSNNEISVVENLQYFGHLQQLSLSGNHIVDIKGISAALTLRVLDLSNNSIIAIEGVSSLRNLEWLNLSGNTIKHIENLDRNYNLYHLDLSDNSIAVISGLKTLMKLKTLLLHGNLISSLEGIIDQVSNTVCTLSLADNEISDLNEVVHLSSLTNLEQLSLVNNPCVLTSSSWRLEVNYRPYLVYCCGNLRNLDGNLVNDQERMLARLLDQAFRRIGHPSPGQHAQLVSILHHLCSDSDPVDQSVQADEVDDLDGNKLLESESFYIPVPSSDVEQTESDDPIMSEEEAIRLFSLAATIIQAHVRGYLVRKKFDFCQYRRRKYAAASIQAVWKGYRARTRDIKVINIRNELRVRRLISLITNLYSALEREHEDAVKSREQLKTAIKYLWHQITEQKRLNQIQLHKEQVKAAIKIQAWWRGCMHKKAFPHKSLNRDKVSILFSLCRKLQMQLDVVTSQINEITKGEKRSKEFRPEDQTVSEGQGQFHDTIRQLDSSQYNISSVPDGEADYTETLSYSSALDQLDAKPGASAAHSLDDAQARTMKTEDLATHENNMPAPSQIGLEEKLVCSNDFVPLDIKEGDTVPSLADQMDHVENETPESNTPKMDLGLTKKISTSLEEGILVTSSLTENNQGPSFAGHTDCYKSDKEHSLDRPIDHDTDDTHDEGAVHRASVVLSPVTQEESQNETEAIVPEAQMDQLEEDTALRTGSPASDVVSLESQLTDGDPSEGDASAEETLHVSIPEIIVSGPIPTDDEGSDAGSAVEGDANDVQKKVDDSAMERQSTDDKQPDVDLTREVPSSCQKSEGHTSYTDTNTDQMKENTSPKQEGGISEKYHENKLLPFRRPTDFSTSQKEASTGVTPSKEAAVTDQSGRTVSSESVHVPNLGERASSLLSQLRSEIASMKTARLNNASPIQEADSAGDGTEMSQQSDMSQSAPQERDSSPLGPVSAVTYRLPLFEDVDSACSSFSLDDFLSDPVNSEEASETDHVHEGAAN